MKTIGVVALLAGSLIFWPSEPGVKLSVAARPMQVPARRVGINLGVWTSWGAEQLSANVLKNPGFEGLIDGAIVIVQASGSFWFQDDTSWLARPDGFWEGGEFSVRTGSLAGREGGVTRSSVENGVALFRVDKNLDGLQLGDVIAVRTARCPTRPTHWWYSPGDGTILAEPGSRPDGEGSTVLRLSAGSGAAGVSSFLDTIGNRAGKLLPVNGMWSLSVWVKASGTNVPFQVRLHRQGAPAFVNETAYAGMEWTQLVWRFNASDDGPPGSLELRFEIAQPGASLWLDDAALEQEPAGTRAFRQPVESALRAIRPGYLRDWQGQLGDTLQNRLANSSARRPFRYRPGGNEATDYGYALPDFLALCERVGAQPWVVLPTTLNDREWQQAGAYLREACTRHRFREVLVEFGNENWNPVFRPAGIPDNGAVSAAASRAFHLLKQGALQDERIVPVLGGNYFAPQQLRAIAGAHADALTGIAPYWAFNLQPGGGPGQLFADAGDLSSATAAAGRAAIYEMNASSLGAAAALAETNSLVASRAAGSALAWHSLHALSAGINRQCVYSLAGFDTFDSAGRLVLLFGIVRDLADDVAMRPTAMALALLNRVAEGEMHLVDSSSADATALAFRRGTRWRAAICSRSAQAVRVRVEFPSGAPFAGRAIALDSATALENNESAPQVREREIALRPVAGGVELEVPAYGLVVLLAARGEE